MTSPHATPNAGLEGESLGNLLRMAYLGFVDRVHAGLAEAGFGDVRPAHLTVFQHLDPGGTRVTTLAERAHLTNQSVSALVDYLEERGYVERRPDPTHRRATLVCLTERGEAEGRACGAILSGLEQSLTQQIGADALAAFRRTLLGVVRTLDEAVADGG